MKIYIDCLVYLRIVIVKFFEGVVDANGKGYVGKDYTIGVW